MAGSPNLAASVSFGSLPGLTSPLKTSSRLNGSRRGSSWRELKRGQDKHDPEFSEAVERERRRSNRFDEPIAKVRMLLVDAVQELHSVLSAVEDALKDAEAGDTGRVTRQLLNIQCDVGRTLRVVEEPCNRAAVELVEQQLQQQFKELESQRQLASSLRVRLDEAEGSAKEMEVRHKFQLKEADRRAEEVLFPPDQAPHPSKAPAGQRCCAVACLEVESEGLLWDGSVVSLGTAQEAAAVYRGVVRQELKEHKGYEASCEGLGAVCCFASAVDALAWSVAVQRGLLIANWPAELLVDCLPTPPDVPLAEGEERVPRPNPFRELHDPDGNRIYRGLRVCIGIEYGEAHSQRGTEAAHRRRMYYSGPPLHRARAVCQQGAGGEILMAGGALEAVVSAGKERQERSKDREKDKEQEREQEDKSDTFQQQGLRWFHTDPRVLPGYSSPACPNQQPEAEMLCTVIVPELCHRREMCLAAERDRKVDSMVRANWWFTKVSIDQQTKDKAAGISNRVDKITAEMNERHGDNVKRMEEVMQAAEQTHKEEVAQTTEEMRQVRSRMRALLRGRGYTDETVEAYIDGELDIDDPAMSRPQVQTVAEYLAKLRRTAASGPAKGERREDWKEALRRVEWLWVGMVEAGGRSPPIAPVEQQRAVRRATFSASPFGLTGRRSSSDVLLEEVKGRRSSSGMLPRPQSAPMRRASRPVEAKRASITQDGAADGSLTPSSPASHGNSGSPPVPPQPTPSEEPSPAVVPSPSPAQPEDPEKEQGKTEKEREKRQEKEEEKKMESEEDRGDEPEANPYGIPVDDPLVMRVEEAAKEKLARLPVANRQKAMGRSSFRQWRRMSYSQRLVAVMEEEPEKPPEPAPVEESDSRSAFDYFCDFCRSVQVSGVAAEEQPGQGMATLTARWEALPADAGVRRHCERLAAEKPVPDGDGSASPTSSSPRRRSNSLRRRHSGTRSRGRSHSVGASPLSSPSSDTRPSLKGVSSPPPVLASSYSPPAGIVPLPIGSNSGSPPGSPARSRAPPQQECRLGRSRASTVTSRAAVDSPRMDAAEPELRAGRQGAELRGEPRERSASTVRWSESAAPRPVRQSSGTTALRQKRASPADAGPARPPRSVSIVETATAVHPPSASDEDAGPQSASPAPAATEVCPFAAVETWQSPICTAPPDDSKWEVDRSEGTRQSVHSLAVRAPPAAERRVSGAVGPRRKSVMAAAAARRQSNAARRGTVRRVSAIDRLLVQTAEAGCQTESVTRVNVACFASVGDGPVAPVSPPLTSAIAALRQYELAITPTPSPMPSPILPQQEHGAAPTTPSEKAVRVPGQAVAVLPSPLVPEGWRHRRGRVRGVDPTGAVIVGFGRSHSVCKAFRVDALRVCSLLSAADDGAPLQAAAAADTQTDPPPTAADAATQCLPPAEERPARQVWLEEQLARQSELLRDSQQRLAELTEKVGAMEQESEARAARDSAFWKPPEKVADLQAELPTERPAATACVCENAAELLSVLCDSADRLLGNGPSFAFSPPADVRQMRAGCCRLFCSTMVRQQNSPYALRHQPDGGPVDPVTALNEMAAADWVRTAVRAAGESGVGVQPVLVGRMLKLWLAMFDFAEGVAAHLSVAVSPTKNDSSMSLSPARLRSVGVTETEAPESPIRQLLRKAQEPPRKESRGLRSVLGRFHVLAELLDADGPARERWEKTRDEGLFKGMRIPSHAMPRTWLATTKRSKKAGALP
eukprot:TRINITY_DN13886_c0_g1_i1.p1 TRINITY_DN13886_c0_g1~~TRINITY_DN13886_c0_g1_i1.p1  ORF type:complete len:1741 (+),score=566.89 TRINITY_DN13886_c0_g1_i1:46-5223(+)